MLPSKSFFSVRELTTPDAFGNRVIPVSPDTLYDAINAGSIPALRVGKRVLVARTIVEQILRGERPGVPSTDEARSDRTAAGR